MKKNNDTISYTCSNRALHDFHRDWVPEYENAYILILTFANDVSEDYARKMYSWLIVKLSKLIYKNAAKDKRGKKRIPQRGYLETTEDGRFHIHTLLDVRMDWDEKFVATVNKLWKFGLVIEAKKVPSEQILYIHKYNSKMKTKRSESGKYSDSYLVVD